MPPVADPRQIALNYFYYQGIGFRFGKALRCMCAGIRMSRKHELIVPLLKTGISLFYVMGWVKENKKKPWLGIV